MVSNLRFLPVPRFLLVLALAGGRPPLDFSGVWVLDENASRGVSPHMRGAVLSVEQNGNHIRILPLGHRDKLLGDEIVADGRPYEKTLGNGKGVVTAGWSKDRGSLWLEVTGGTPDKPRAAIQRSVWKLSSDRKTWIRHSVSSSGGEKAEARLVFRRRDRWSSDSKTPGSVTTPKARD